MQIGWGIGSLCELLAGKAGLTLIEPHGIRREVLEERLLPSNDERASGDWGGLVINGRAPVNNVGEGGALPLCEGDSGPYGGNAANDSSGSLQFVRVEFGGIRFTDENELNGIALQGVGTGTVLENIQVVGGSDDGIEFFGGTANISNALVVIFPEDRAKWNNLRLSEKMRLVRTTFSQQRGRYELDGLPISSYRVVAVTSLPRNAWIDPEVIDRLWPFTTSVSLDELRENTLPLKVVPAPTDLLQ